MKKSVYWNWFWGVDQKNLNKRSKSIKFKDFDKMKEYSAKHSLEHNWMGQNYWSDYEKIIE